MNCATLECALLDDRDFAAVDALLAMAQTHARFSVDLLSEQFPEAARLASALDAAEAAAAESALLSPSLRCAVRYLLTESSQSSETARRRLCSQVIEAAANCLARLELRAHATLPAEDYALPLAHGVGYDVEWSESSLAEATGAAWALIGSEFERTIAAELRLEGHVAALELSLPAVHEARVLDSGARLLTALTPQLWPSLAQHVRLVAVVTTNQPHGSRQQLLSASDASTPGALFMAQVALQDRLAAAEALMHEATHQRLYELLICNSFYTPGQADTRSPSVVPPWYQQESGGSRPWRVNRALAALHVYVHLVTLWSLALVRPEVLTIRERTTVASRLARSTYKGSYLIGALRGPLRPALSRHGMLFVDYLAQGLERTRHVPNDTPDVGASYVRSAP